MALLDELALPATLAPDQGDQATLERLAKLAPDFDARAGIHDLEATLPSENFADLRAAGLLGLQIPREFGGSGLDPARYCAAIANMAVGDASTAIAYNMHSSAMLSLALLATRQQQERWFGRVVADGIIVAALGSEPGLKPFVDGALPRTTLVRAESGFLLNGTKTYCSFGRHADALYVAANLDGHVAFALVDAQAEGITRSNDWSVMSMRSTESVTTCFSDVPVLAEDVVLPPDHRQALLLEIEFALGYGPIYLASACAAADRAVTDMLPRAAPGTADEALLAAQLGALIAIARPAWLTCLNAATTGRVGDLARARAIALAKAVAADAACLIAEQALRLRGGRGLGLNDAVGRAFRDVQAGQVMAFSPELARRMMGLLSIGRPPEYLRRLIDRDGARTSNDLDG